MSKRALVIGVVLLLSADSLFGDDEKGKGEKGADEKRALEVVRNVTYVHRGDQSLKADVHVPPGDGPYPGVLMVHGGAWVSGAKWHMNRHARLLADKQFTVVAINYRLAPKDKFPAQIEDCKEAVRWMRRNAEKYKIDVKRIAGYGYSAGGHLVALLGATDANNGLEGKPTEGKSVSTRLQAVIAGGAPCDFGLIPANSKALAFFLGGTRREIPEVYRQASPVSFVTADDPPTLFYHGEKDTLVPQRSPTTMLDKLKGAGVRTEMLVVPEATHIGAFMHEDPPKKAIEFLNEVLAQDKPPASNP